MSPRGLLRDLASRMNGPIVSATAFGFDTGESLAKADL